MPQTFVVFLIGTLSLAGIPLFAGFFSKETILGGVWTGHLDVPFAMLALAAFLTAFYMFRVVFIAFFGEPRAVAHPPAEAHAAAYAEPDVRAGTRAAPDPHATHPHDPPASMAIPLWILAALSMAIGIGFSIRHPEAEFEAPGWITPLAVVLAVGGILLAWLTYDRRLVAPERLANSFALIRDAAVQRFWLDDAYLVLYRAMLALARIVGWIDRYIVDGIVNLASAGALQAGDRLRRIQSGHAQDYVYGVAVGVLLLIVWFRWLG
jgi:NADH-quinone oxidoreductase subunit L